MPRSVWPKLPMVTAPVPYRISGAPPLEACAEHQPSELLRAPPQFKMVDSAIQIF